MRPTIILLTAVQVCLVGWLAACLRESSRPQPTSTPETMVGLTSPTATPTPTLITVQLLTTRVFSVDEASPITLFTLSPLATKTPTTVPPSATLTTLPATATQVPAANAHLTPMALPSPSQLTDVYTVQPGDTLGGISWAFGVPLEDLLELNGFESDRVIIQVGQTINVPLKISQTGPRHILLPDSEVVYSPAYVNFSTAAFIAEQNGYLSTYFEHVNGERLNGAEVVDLVAQRYSVGPRVLLAVLEFYGGWVTQSQTPGYGSRGPANLHGDSLYLSLAWLADQINDGYYGYKQQGQKPLRLRDRTRVLAPPGLNAGTVGIQNVLAVNTDWETWLQQVSPEGFIQTYRRLFGDPFILAQQPLIPATLTQPELKLPWQTGQTFYYTGGPHGAYGDGSRGTAIDFGPPDILGSCYYSQEYITAAATGKVIKGDKGEIYLDLDLDGHLQTGWVLFYLHVVALDTLAQGQIVSAGTPLGVASCEGGLATASHLHFARRYQGEWMLANGPVPMMLSGWQVVAGAGPYDGQLIRGDVVKISGQFWDELNAIVAD